MTEWHKDSWLISTDKARIELETVHRYLSQESYWARGIPLEVVRRSIEGSICFGLYQGERQLGFARLISDLATFAYLCDVFILPEHQGRGLGTWLVEVIGGYLEPLGLRMWLLGTLDAHDLYRKIGFAEPPDPSRLMMRRFPDVYAPAPSTD